MKKRALALGVFALAGGAAWWYSRRDPAAAPAGDVLSEAEDAAQTLYEGVVSAVTPGAWSPPGRAQPYLAAIAEAELRYGIPTNLLARLLYQESHFRDDIITGRVVSRTGAQGIAQFMPATAAQLGIDPLNVPQAIDAAGRYLRSLFDQTGGASWRAALAAYNWGIGHVQRLGLNAAPPETVQYVADIAGDVGLA